MASRTTKAPMRGAAIGILCLFATGALANPKPGAERMHWQLLNVGYTPTFSANWITLMPEVANDCGFKLSKAQLYNVAGKFRDQFGISTMVRGINNGTASNMMRDDWRIMVADQKDDACSLANKLWGEDGAQFPGVLTGP